MKLLIVTQKIDKNDAILGFFHGWIAEFAKHCERVTVICLFEGVHHLPENVKVLSLGKEKKHSRPQYLTRFYRYIWQERKNYDVVFVHMNPEYVVLGGLPWKTLGKKVFLWYTHKSVNLKLRIAESLTTLIFTAAKESFHLVSKKVRVVGHGIDVGRYAESLTPVRTPPRIVSVGRITPIKRLEVMIEAVKALENNGIRVHLTLIGGPVMPDDKKYEDRLHALIHALELKDGVSLVGPMSHDSMSDEYRKYDISINMAPTGGIDKAVLESMASGLVVIVANKAFTQYFGKYVDMLLCKASPED
ncbi:MAG: glycosyltransferase family 4 protein, partial [Candidatus Azambacteria bacterium]|nr:glycosyltransferase family 4 protein [Candidatus Azambacteria bacterium]